MEGEVEEEIREKKVMVAIDESEESYSALLWALDNLRDTFNSHRLLIFAAEPPPNYINIFAASLSSARLYSTVNNSTTDHSLNISLFFRLRGIYRFKIERELSNLVVEAADFVNSRQEIEKKVAIGILEKAKTICTARGILAETILEEGDAKEAICETVEKHHITILILAEQRIGRVQAAFRWSVSDYCVQYAKCPVLVVKNSDPVAPDS